MLSFERIKHEAHTALVSLSGFVCRVDFQATYPLRRTYFNEKNKRID